MIYFSLQQIRIRLYGMFLVHLRVELADQLGLLDKNEFRFLWVTEFPQFEWSDEENRFVAMHHPFTMPMDEDLEYA